MANTELQGLLETNIYSLDTNRTKAWLRHLHNIPDKTIFGEIKIGRWSINASELRNGTADMLPNVYANRDFQREQAGVAHIAYFPVDDFESLLEAYSHERSDAQKAYFKARVRGLVEKAKVRLTGTESLVVTIGSGGVHVDYRDYEATREKNQLLAAQGEADSLKDNLDRAAKNNQTHLILERGFGLSDTEPGDQSRTEVVILGDEETTSDLIQNIGVDPQMLQRVMQDLFAPGENNVDFKSSIPHSSDDNYNTGFYKNGEYRPFGEVKQIHLYDHRTANG